MTHTLCRPGTVALATVASLLTAFSAAGQPLPDLQDVPVVAHARVVSTLAQWDRPNGVIVTYVALEVVEALRGDAVPARLVLKQLGGEVGGLGLWIADQAVFRPGEEALLFLSANSVDGSLHTTALARGKLASTPATLSAARLALAAAPPAERRVYLAEPWEYRAALGDPSSNFAYLPTDGGYPARWHEVDDDLAVFVDHPSALPATWSGSTAEAGAAITLWRNSGMQLDLRNGGPSFPTGKCSADFTGNGRIAVSYNDPCGGVADWSVGGGYYTTGDLRTVNGTEFQKFIQGFVILNDAGPQTSSAGCFQDAITHGLGHALGLGHSNSAGAIMAAQPPPGCASGPRGLGADDTAGVTSIYQGIASGPTPPDTPTAFTATALLSTVTLAWTPATTGGPPQRYILDAGTAPGVYNLGSSVFNAPTVSTSVGGVPAGTYYLRLRAQNAAGTSAPTAERQVTVGACAVPAAPSGFTASANDTFVNLRWTAPASGLVQGYRLAVGSAPGLANLGVQDYAASVTSLAGPAPYGSYFVRVHATNVCGISAPSNEVNLLVQPCTAAPGAPTGLSVTKNGTFVAFSWSAPAGVAPTGYTFAVGSAPGASNLLVFSTGNANTTLAGSAPPGTYYVRVIAQNACGQSGASHEILVVVP